MLHWPVVFALVVAGVALVYYVAPNPAEPPFCHGPCIRTLRLKNGGELWPLVELR
jgi:hypothetical protein